MKFLIGLFAIVLSVGVFADEGELRTFTYNGSQNSTEMILRGEKTHTEYRTENQQTTCYRTEVVGHRTICTGGGPGPGYCHPTPRGQICQSFPTPARCYNQPIYGQVPYSCMQTVNVPFEVTDYQTEARVIVDITKNSEATTPGERITVELKGESLEYKASGSKKFFIVEKAFSKRSSMSGNVKMIDGLVAVELIEAAPIMKALKMTNIGIQNGVLKFDIGEVAARNNLKFSLVIKKTKFLGSDKELLNRELTANEVEVNASQKGATASVNLDQLGVELEDGKFEITAKVEAKVDGEMKNRIQFGDDLSASRKLIYKVR